MLTCAIISLSFVILWKVVGIIHDMCTNTNAYSFMLGMLVDLGFITLAILGLIGVSRVY